MSSVPLPDWQLMARRIAERKCVPFLGAGASLGSGIPSAGSIAQELATECSYPGSDPWDFLRVCQYYAMKFDKDAVRQAVRKRVLVPGGPGEVHQILASMPFPFVLTTNYDSLMERAFGNAAKSATEMTYVVGGDKVEIPEVREDAPIVYKIHGSVSDYTKMVVSEDDVVDFMTSVLLNNPPLPQYVSTALKAKSVLFIGYGLKDWNIRVLLRALRGKGSSIRAFSVQRRPADAALADEWDLTVMHLLKDEMYCYDIDAVEFVTELKKHYDALGGGK